MANNLLLLLEQMLANMITFIVILVQYSLSDEYAKPATSAAAGVATASASNESIQ